jgi:hypothetical protein
MDKKLKQAAAALRICIDEHRDAHQRALKAVRKNGSYRDETAHDLVQQTHARLAYLIPMYRALCAAAQQRQSIAGGEKGAQLYLMRFRSMQDKLRQAALYPRHGLTEKLFGDGLLKFPVLVPDPRVTPLEWQFRPIGELLEQVKAELELERRAAIARDNEAMLARRAFVDSLNDGQRILLKQALEAAAAKGTYAVSFHMRDLTI